MRAIGIALIVAAFWLFQRAPDGVNVSSVGSLALLLAAISFFFAARSRDLAARMTPLAGELGLSDAGSWSCRPSARVVFRGEREGRAVELRIVEQTLRGRRGPSTTIYLVDGNISCRNPRRLRLAILPTLGPLNLYLEFLPPRIAHAELGEIGYQVHYGAPREEAVSLPQRLDRNSYAGLRGDSAKIRLNRERCSFELSTTKTPPAGARLRELLSLCARISEQADA